MWKSIAGTRGYSLCRISDFSAVLHRINQFLGFPPAGITGERGEEKNFLVLIENLFTNRQKCDTILADRLLGTLFLRQKLMEGEVKP